MHFAHYKKIKIVNSGILSFTVHIFAHAYRFRIENISTFTLRNTELNPKQNQIIIHPKKQKKMKKLIALLIIAVVAFGCGSQGEKSTQNQEQETVTIDPANLETIEIEVHGMTCGGCERTVKNAVEELPGVQEVTASHTDSVAVVIFDKTQAGFGAMKAAINDKGYKAIDYKVVE